MSTVANPHHSVADYVLQRQVTIQQSSHTCTLYSTAKKEGCRYPLSPAAHSQVLCPYLNTQRIMQVTRTCTTTDGHSLKQKASPHPNAMKCAISRHCQYSSGLKKVCSRSACARRKIYEMIKTLNVDPVTLLRLPDLKRLHALHTL